MDANEREFFGILFGYWLSVFGFQLSVLQENMLFSGIYRKLKTHTGSPVTPLKSEEPNI
jgi:hypothetical protein